ncbi:MAG: hypothetical protein AAFX79_05070 [Planctomycetota bacterium]
MVLDEARHIQRVRTTRAAVLWGLRLLAVLLLVAGGYLVLARLAFGLMLGKLSLGWNIYVGVGEGHSMSHGVAMLAVGAALAATAGILSRWIVAVPDVGCPRCRYTGESTAEGLCPECGLGLRG